MKKILFLTVIIILMFFPLILFIIDKNQTLYEFQNLKSLLNTEIYNYKRFVKELVKYKQPDGYIVDDEKIYYKGNLIEEKVIDKGFIVLNIDGNYELFFIWDSKLFLIPKIKSNFLIFDINGRIITEDNFSHLIGDIFPKINDNITFYKGLRVYYEKIELGNNIDAIVYLKVPIHHLLLYFLFIPISIFLFLESDILKSKVSKDKEE
ncbi:MAG: hypothetical protein H0Z24_00595 [Thermosipho sp. (in: Bacteria)]|nr:hypothetical protein [Thermosipho sp. (in: thermotogales)]